MDRAVPNKSVKQKRVVIYVPEEDYKQLRAKLILTGKTVSEWIRAVIKNFIANN